MRLFPVSTSDTKMASDDFDVLFTFNEDPCYCNGNGDVSQCMATGQCVCNPGFTGRADFSDGNFSCHINSTAIIILWSLVLVAVVLSYVLSSRKVKIMIDKFLRTRTRMKKKGKTYTLRSHRGLTVVLIMYGLVLPILVALAGLRIADDQQRVGLSIPFTVLWTLLYVSFAIASHRYTTAIATAMLRAEQSTNSYIARGRWFGRGLLMSQALLSVFAYPILIEGSYSKWTSRICMILYLICGVITFSTTGYWSRWVKKQTMVVLSEHPEHGDLKHRMEGMLIGVAWQSWFIAAVFSLAVCIPIFWTVHDYYEPILFLSIPLFASKATSSIYVPGNGGVGAASTVNDNTVVKQLMTAGVDDPHSEVQ